MPQYRWQGSNLHPPTGDSTTIFRHLEHLRSQEELTSDLVVGDARARTSPTHRYFEWNDTKAAHKHRKAQAAQLVAHIVQQDGEKVRRVYLSVAGREGSPRHFDLASRVMRSPESRRPYARRALLQLQNWEQRYQDFPELQASLAAVKSALRRIVRPALREIEEASV